MCVICMDVVTRGDQVLALPCSHVFHADCILPYLEDGDSEVRRCPLDRAVIQVPLEQLAVWNWGSDNSNGIESDFDSNVAAASTSIESDVVVDQVVDVTTSNSSNNGIDSNSPIAI